jgi:ADYC domain
MSENLEKGPIRRARRRGSRWTARAALALLLASGGACVRFAADPAVPGGPGASAGAGGGAGGGAGAGAGGAAGQGALPTGCNKNDCDVPPPNTPPLRPHCPTGPSCDVGGTNGRGIYIAREFDYCMTDEASPGSVYCPEGFVNENVNGNGGGVSFLMRDPRNPQNVRKDKVGARLVSSTGQRPIKPLRIRAEQTELFVRYDDAGTEREVSGAALSGLELLLMAPAASPRFNVAIRIEPLPARSSSAVRRYSITYHPADSQTPVRRHCGAAKDGLGASFLPGRQVDGLTAEVNLNANATTMSCETGAIDTCLEWGYAPWAPKVAAAAGAGDHLFATCLQAKRAAYYIGLGDTRSYTVEGTEIYKRDPFGIFDEPRGLPDGWQNGIEAIWGPRGAVCLNVDRRRRPDLPFVARPEVPPCSPAQWSAAGKISTMPKAKAP